MAPSVRVKIKYEFVIYLATNFKFMEIKVLFLITKGNSKILVKFCKIRSALFKLSTNGFLFDIFRLPLKTFFQKKPNS